MTDTDKADRSKVIGAARPATTARPLPLAAPPPPAAAEPAGQHEHPVARAQRVLGGQRAPDRPVDVVLEPGDDGPPPATVADLLDEARAAVGDVRAAADTDKRLAATLAGALDTVLDAVEGIAAAAGVLEVTP